MARQINVALIGYKFMGKAHSHAYKVMDFFFKRDCIPVMKVICGRHESPLKAAAKTWGWEEYNTSWEHVVERKDIDLVDIASPQNTHRDIAIAAAKAGKHILLEKPTAMNAQEASEMLDAVKKAGVKHMIGFNYRRVPAIVLAKRLIQEGKIGRIFHWRACYLQDWIVDENFPLIWKLKKEIAGAGAHGDLNSHLIDLARYLVGEIKSVLGMKQTFIKQRPLPDDSDELNTMLTAGAGRDMGEVTVDDATSFLAEFENGTMGSFEATRFASGRKNFNSFEIYGSKGSLCFNFESMNELLYFSREDENYTQGFKRILATEGSHPYINAWWPPGHIIGYEHTFVNQIADFMECIANDTMPEPNFYDGLRNQQVMDAVMESAEKGMKVVIQS
ncbi:MAG: Gfo/Idh/MocA family oxidoreductase [Candidatus Poribacteria bacterium]